MVSIRHGRAIAVTVALLLTACDFGDVTDHRAASRGAPLISSVSQTSFATGFEQYPLGQLLHEADWTRIQRWPSGGTPILGEWRVRSVPAWVWIHVSHTISGGDGTIRYRVWQGARENEPTTWDHEETSNWFGPDGGTPGPGITGKAGLFAAGHADMANAELYWDYFATDTGSACPDTVQTI